MLDDVLKRSDKFQNAIGVTVSSNNIGLYSKLILREVCELVEADNELDTVDALCDIAVLISAVNHIDNTDNNLSIRLPNLPHGIVHVVENATSLVTNMMIVASVDSKEYINSSFYTHSVIAYIRSCYDNLYPHRQFQKDLLAVVESNESKFCIDGEIEPTIEKYRKMGVECRCVNIENGLTAIFADNTTPDFPKGKLLKSIGYHSPLFYVKG